MEKVQWVKAPVAKAEDLSSVPGTYMVEQKNQFPPVVL